MTFPYSGEAEFIEQQMSSTDIPISLPTGEVEFMGQQQSSVSIPSSINGEVERGEPQG